MRFMPDKKLIFWGACIGILLFGVGITTLGSVKQDLMVRFQLDEIGAGTLFSVVPLGILMGSLLFGPASDRYGYKYILAGCCFCMFLGFEGLAYAPSWTLIWVSIFLFGLGGGAINGATSALVADLSKEKKGANLSILGVFFGLGALGMPLVLAALEKIISYVNILMVIGFFSFAVAVFYLCIRFPMAKLNNGFPKGEVKKILQDPVLILIAFFLFCQSSLEALVNNWTTSYLTDVKSFTIKNALLSLSFSVAGMTVMRLLLGSLLKNLSFKSLWVISFAFLALGLGGLRFGYNQTVIFFALMVLGGGLAAGFPLMLGLLAERFSHLSATAFSVVLVIALTGNTIVNYLMGIVAEHSGVSNLTYAIGLEWIVMVVLFVLLFYKIKGLGSA